MRRANISLAVVVGTRPEAIKLAPVIRRLRADGRFAVRLLATGQHREMLSQALQTMGLVLDADLNLMRPGQGLASFIGAALPQLEKILQHWRPQAVLVQGDTGTTLAAALAAYYQHIPVGHVEAGLRSFDQENPFPEEANRTLVSRIATWHFAPTPLAAANLFAEGIASTKVFVTGNTVVDALYDLLGIKPGEVIPLPIERVMITAHRRENFGPPLREICAALKPLARRHPEVEWIFPVHPNPEVKRLVKLHLGRPPANLHLVKPLAYPEFIRLLAQSRLAVTDSGGVQEEAAVLGIPLIVMRAITERPEALGNGGLLVPPNRRVLVEKVSALLAKKNQPRKIRVSPFGDGQASARIVQALAWAFGLEQRKPKPFVFRPGE
jgi:UDP-N-acetylglucosamine 2-epimerase (non-hydrolysing)